MAREIFSRFDAADYLKSKEDIVAYLDAAAAENDAALMARALGTVARARNMSALARETGMTRQGLSKALSPTGSPTLATTMSVLSALNLKFEVSQNTAAKSIDVPHTHKGAKPTKSVKPSRIVVAKRPGTGRSAPRGRQDG